MTSSRPRLDPQGVRAVPVLVALTIASPTIGLILEIVLAWRFSSGALVDGFRVGSLVTYFAAQLFLVGVLPNILVPAYASARAQHGSDSRAAELILGVTLLWLAPGVIVGALVAIN